jgi:hypothetical protein
MKYLALLGMLAVSLSCFAQTPAPSCLDGGMNFVFEAAVSGLQQPGPYPHTSAWGFGGAVDPCGTWPQFTSGNWMKWRTGPVLTRDANSGIATFGPCVKGVHKCGVFWHVDNSGGSQTHLLCGTSNPCTFNGVWKDFAITLDAVALAGGSYVYVLDGHATGTYCDPELGCLTGITATYHQNSLPFAGPFLADQSFGGGAFGGASIEFDTFVLP